MKLKLIEAGGFAGLKKTAEADLTQLPTALRQHVETIFTNHTTRPAPAQAQSVHRDKENYFIEYNGKVLPVKTLLHNKELEALIEKLKSILHF